MNAGLKPESPSQPELQSFIESVRLRLKEFGEWNQNLSQIGYRLVESLPGLAENAKVSPQTQPGYISDLREIDLCLNDELNRLRQTIEKLNKLI